MTSLIIYSWQLECDAEEKDGGLCAIFFFVSALRKEDACGGQLPVDVCVCVWGYHGVFCGGVIQGEFLLLEAMDGAYFFLKKP